MKFTTQSFTLSLPTLSLSETKEIQLDPTPAFVAAPRESQTHCQDWVAQAQQLQNSHDAVLCIGIGGSHLGPMALIEALGKNHKPLHWLSNVDPIAVKKAAAFVEQHNPATVVISKSGNTIETLAGFFHLLPKLDPKGIVTITDADQGELRRLTNQNNWTSFSVPKELGGRFSVLSAVGLFPAALANIDIELVCKAAQDPALETAAQTFGKAHYLWDQQGHSLQYVMPYWSALQTWAQWYVQLWNESLGKKRRSDHQSVGPTAIAALGSQDQHSLLQLFSEGPRNKVVGFVDILASEEVRPIRTPDQSEALYEAAHPYLAKHSFDHLSHQACLATQQSLHQEGVPTYVLEAPRLDAALMGQLFYFYELACAYAAHHYDVNAYDQPGVESMKRLWKQNLL